MKKKLSEISALIVDDSKTICRINSMILKDIGINDVDIAYDGAEGVQLAKNKHYDLILSDINMPIMTGFGLVENIRKFKTKEETIIFMVTTEGGREEVIKALRLGANNYIVKPVVKENIIEKIKTFFEE